MIASAKIMEVERLLAEGNFSQRKIARITGVSRATIAAIAHGRRPNYDELRRNRGVDRPEPLGPLERCASCGGMVYMPCRLCQVRQLKAQEQAAARLRRRLARQAALRHLLIAIRQAQLRADHASVPFRRQPVAASATRARAPLADRVA